MGAAHTKDGNTRRKKAVKAILMFDNPGGMIFHIY
jgi:hypothetical protein